MGTLKKNVFYQTVYQMLIIILPFITAPYVARVLGAENSGIYSYTYTIANYFVIFGMLGLEQYGNRCIAKVRNNYDKMCEVFSELLLLHVIISGVIIGVYGLYILVFASQYSIVFIIQSMYVISCLFDINWFFFGIEQFKITVVRNSLIKILTVVSIFIFVRNREDLNIYTFILSISTLISQIAIWPMLRKFVKFKKVPFSSLRNHMKPLIILFIAVIAANLNRMIDKLMLGKFGIMNDLGCYDYADKIIRIPLSLIAAIGTVMLSKMSNLYANEDQKESEKILDVSAYIVLIVSFAMAFGIAAIAPEFINIYLGKEYAESSLLLMILSLSIPLVGWNNYVRTQILIPRELDKIYTRAVTIGAIINIAINLILIPLYSARGAAIATIVSYLAISIMQTIPLREQGNLRKYLSYTIFPICAGLIMYCCVRVVNLFIRGLVVSLVTEIVVGVLVYMLLTFIYVKKSKPEILKLIRIK